MTHNVIRVNSQGRVTIPASLRSALGFEPGTSVVAYVEDGRLVLEHRAHVLNRMQDEALAAAERSGQAGHSVVQDLLAERRAAAELEQAAT